MPWLKFLHIVALVVWCGALLYLPALLWQGVSRESRSGFGSDAPPVPRLFFNTLATPAALLAIASGTLLFLANDLLGGWLVVKLVAVSGMVVSHALLGWLILRLEEERLGGLRVASLACALLAGFGMLAVIVLVLSKPLDWSGGLP